MGIYLQRSSFIFSFKIDFHGCVYTVHGLELQNFFMLVYHVLIVYFLCTLLSFFFPLSVSLLCFSGQFCFYSYNLLIHDFMYLYKS